MLMTVQDARGDDVAVPVNGRLWYQLAGVAGETGRVRDLVEAAVRQVYGREFVAGDPDVDAGDRTRLRAMFAKGLTLPQVALRIDRPVDWVRRAAKEMGLETARQKQVRLSRERKRA